MNCRTQTFLKSGTIRLAADLPLDHFFSFVLSSSSHFLVVLPFHIPFAFRMSFLFFLLIPYSSFFFRFFLLSFVPPFRSLFRSHSVLFPLSILCFPFLLFLPFLHISYFFSSFSFIFTSFRFRFFRSFIFFLFSSSLFYSYFP